MTGIDGVSIPSPDQPTGPTPVERALGWRAEGKALTILIDDVRALRDRPGCRVARSSAAGVETDQPFDIGRVHVHASRSGDPDHALQGAL